MLLSDKAKLKSQQAFKNISEILIELLENPPNFTTSKEQDHSAVTAAAAVSTSTQVDQLVQGENMEGCMNQKIFGYFLAWNALLQKIDNGRIKCQLQQDSEY